MVASVFAVFGESQGGTDRKVIVDTHRVASRHGEGTFSGTGPSKGGRSTAYALPWVIKSPVTADLADRLKVQVAYAISRAKPVRLYVESFGTGNVNDATIEAAIPQVFGLLPAAIIRGLDLHKPRYATTAIYGHVGRDLPGLMSEQFDRGEPLGVAARLDEPLAAARTNGYPNA